MEKYELGRFAILRRPDFFEIVSPAGGVYQLDEPNIKELLTFHNKYPSDSPSELEKTAFLEGLILKSKSPKQPFQIEKVIGNLNDEDKNILTLSDLVVVINRECNYDCLGCSVNAGFGNVGKVDWKNVISEGASFGAINLGITGGEPLLHDYVDQVCNLASFARKNGYENIVVYTNGTFVPKYVARLKESGITRISVSFHGFDGYSEEYTKNHNAEKNSFQAINAIIEAGMYLRINCVVTSGNVSQIDRIVDKLMPLVRDNEENYLRFSPIIEIGRASNKKNNLSIEQYKTLVEIIVKLKKKYGERLRLTCNEECFPDDPVFCDAGLVYAVINEKGLVSACDLLEDVLTINSLEEKSFSDIWNDNDAWRDFRKIVPINSQCGGCEEKKRQICIGRCKALSFIKFNSLTMINIPNQCF